MSHTRLAPLALAAIALAASGCGGGSTNSSSSQKASSALPEPSGHTETTAQGKSLTKAEMITKVNAICGRIVARLNASPYKTTQDFVRNATPVVSTELTALSELRKLTPPTALAEAWKQVTVSVQVLAQNTAKAAELMKSGSPTATKTVRALVATNYQIRAPLLATAARAGFSECAQVQ